MAVATKRPTDASTVVKDTADHVLVAWSAQGGIKQVVITRAEGSWLYAGERRILDFSSGLINVNLGHGHPKVVRAIQEQAERACYVTPSFGEESRATLARLLSEVTPVVKIVFERSPGVTSARRRASVARLSSPNDGVT